MPKQSKSKKSEKIQQKKQSKQIKQVKERNQTTKKNEINENNQFESIPMTEQNIAKINTLLPIHKYVRIRQWINFIDDLDF